MMINEASNGESAYFSQDESRFDSAQKSAPDAKLWDMFRVLPPQKDLNTKEREASLAKILRFVKLLVAILVFLVVLGCGVIAKGTALFMTSQLSRGKTVAYCNIDLDINRQKSYVATVPLAERIAWTWMLLFALLVPEALSLGRALRIIVFKSVRKPVASDLLLVMFAETCHSVGMALLAFSVLPDLDVVRAVMLTNCLCFIPNLIGLFEEREESGRGSNFFYLFLNVLSLSTQATGFVVWPLVDKGATPSLWLTPLAVFLTSFGWWENYASKLSSLGCMQPLCRAKDRLKKSRYYVFLIASLWKMAVMFFIMLLMWSVRSNGDDIGLLFSSFKDVFSEREIIVNEVRPIFPTSGVEFMPAQPETEVVKVAAWIYAPLWTLLIQVGAAYLCYITGKYACRIMIQGFSYAFPVTITVPVSISLLVVFCGLRNEDPCAFHGVIPDYIFFTSPSIYLLEDFLINQYAWIWLLWLASQIWLTAHIWWPKCERLASTEKLFVTPMYCGLLVDQSLALNRRIDDQADAQPHAVLHPQKQEFGDDYLDNVSIPSDLEFHGTMGNSAAGDGITRIFACATMWHETREEMMEMLKSIFRMDEDQSARRIAQKYLQVTDPDYYEFETHVFFDDAFAPPETSYEGALVNSFVKLLLNTVDEAASHVHETHVHLRAPKKFPTPYGGKLVWTLPGKSKMIAHLKDKSKIRHKKRWSQVMYMYYLLGHRLLELSIPAERKEVIADNTYILALDGDIDFQPSAVKLLVDLMKKNRQLGAACGRIHPVGTGAMVWYQKFEYAVGHWLQKATEHMIGCVLCSPGCFSLFRGKALMDDNVMRKYTTRSEEARQYVQFDQGEDRWLCTLLLQRGYRVEYSAASDAYTHCPEGFNEFYNQRRRWVPSTMANIMDIIGDGKQTVRCNDNISSLYMAYQTMLLGGSILGPGTILLMLVGSFNTAFKMDQWSSFLYNIVPVILFMVVCFFAKSKTQLTFAMLISVLYGMVMIAVLVGILMQISEDGLLAPSSLFFFIVSMQLIVTGLLHPLEVGCLPFGVIYYITVPSMYMLLIIYSLFNLNNVSWGTRETPVPIGNTKQDLERDVEEAKAKKKKSNVFTTFLDGFRSKTRAVEEQGTLSFSLAGLFHCALCTYPKEIDERKQLLRIADNLDVLNRRMENIERSVDPQPLALGRRRSFSVMRTSGSVEREPLGPVAEVVADVDRRLSSDSVHSSEMAEPKHERDDLVDPYWIEDPDLKKGEVDFVSSEEEQFWKDLIDKYLYPLDEDKKKQARIAKDLKALRDKTVFAFFMLNAMFVMILFLIQLNKDLIHINWPLGVKNNITFIKGTAEIFIAKDYLILDPIGLTFLLSFAVVLIIQFIAMLFHRFGTLSHILASTEFAWYFTKTVDDLSADALIDRNAVEIARELQRLKSVDEDKSHRAGAKSKAFSIVDLELRSLRTQHVGSLALAFETKIDRLASISLEAIAEGSSVQKHPPVLRSFAQRRTTVQALVNRRNSVMQERRRSLLVAEDLHHEGTLRHSNMQRQDSVVSWSNLH